MTMPSCLPWSRNVVVDFASFISVHQLKLKLGKWGEVLYSGALGARLSTDAAAVRSMVGDNLALAVQNLSTIVCGLSIAFSANWELALVVLALVPLLSMQSFLQVKFMKGFSNDAKVQSSKLLLPLTSLSPFPYNYHQTKIAC